MNSNLNLEPFWKRYVVSFFIKSWEYLSYLVWFVRRMSYLDETRNSDLYQKMIFLDHIPLIPVEDQDAGDSDHETW